MIQQLRVRSCGICVRRGEVGLTFVSTGKPYVSSLLRVKPSEVPFGGRVMVIVALFSGSTLCLVSLSVDDTTLILRGSIVPCSLRIAGGRSCRRTELGDSHSVSRTLTLYSSTYP